MRRLLPAVLYAQHWLRALGTNYDLLIVFSFIYIIGHAQACLTYRVKKERKKERKNRSKKRSY